MCQENKTSSLVIALIAAFVFGLVMAVFGTSQAADLVKPKTGDHPQIVLFKQNSIENHHKFHLLEGERLPQV